MRIVSWFLLSLFAVLGGGLAANAAGRVAPPQPIQSSDAPKDAPKDAQGEPKDADAGGDESDDGAENAAAVVVRRNLAYVEGDHLPAGQRLDLYLPKKADKAPVIVFFHGGGWCLASKAEGRGFGLALASRGYIVASVGYRLVPLLRAPEAAEQYPRFVKDAARGFDWLHKHVAAHGGDPERMYLSGHSAGAHIAALLATDESYLKEYGLESGKVVKGLIAFSGVYVIPERVPAEARHFAPLIDRAFPNDRDQRAAASPANHIDAKDPPALLLYADADYPLLDESAKLLHQELGKAGVTSTLREVPDRTHLTLFYQVGKGDDRVIELLLAFLSGKAIPELKALPKTPEEDEGKEGGNEQPSAPSDDSEEDF